MTIENDRTANRDTPPRIVSHRLQKTSFDSQRPAAPPIDEHHHNDQPLLRQVILVDRDIDALRDIAIALREDFEFHISISGNEALALLQDGSIDTIIVGHTLYSSTGVSVLAAARRYAPHTRRILLANAAEASGINPNASEAGPFRIMPRPCTPDKLRHFLEGSEESIEDSSSTSAYLAPIPTLVQNSTPTRPSRSRMVPPPTAMERTHPIIRPNSSDAPVVEHVVMEQSQSHSRRVQPSQQAELAASKLAVVVFTNDAPFYQAVLQTIGDTYKVRVTTQVETVLELVEMGMCALLITDRAGTQDEMQRLSIEVHSIDSNIVMIAAGSLQDSQGLRSLIGTPALHCFLPRPISPQLTKLAIESARREYLERVNSRSLPHDLLQDPRDVALREPAETGLVRATIAPRSTPYIPGNMSDVFNDSTDWPRVIKIGGTALASIVLVILLGYGVASLRSLPVFQDQGQLILARQAYKDGHYFEPEGANALHYYQQALAQDPQSKAAQQGLQQLGEQLVTRIEQALVEDRFDEAALLLEQLRNVEPSNTRMSYLLTQLQKLRRASEFAAKTSGASSPQLSSTTTSADAARNKPPLVSSSTLNSSGPVVDGERRLTTSGWMQTARERLSQGRLVTPENDSAESYLRQIARVEPNNPTVQQMLRDIGVALVNDARTAIESKQLPRARTLLDHAQRFDGTSNAINDMRQQIEGAESNAARTRLFNLVMQRTRENQLIEPIGDSARHYLEQFQALDGQSADVEQARRTLALQLINNATQAMSQRQYNMAMRLLTEARAIGFSGPELADADQRLRAARSAAN